jgi:hypothetical protein
MTIKIGKYRFEGPYISPAGLEDRSGVYAILCRAGDELHLVDVGESATVRSRVENHDRKDCWKRECSGELRYAAHYTPHLQQSGRREIEQEIRQEYTVPCGQD